MPAVFVAHVEQQLQAQADAQEGLARIVDASTGRSSSQPPQLADGVLERADARQHKLRGGGHLGRIAGDEGLVADVLEGFLHAPQVAHAVVNDGDHRWVAMGVDSRGRRSTRFNLTCWPTDNKGPGVRTPRSKRHAATPGGLAFS